MNTKTSANVSILAGKACCLQETNAMLRLAAMLHIATLNCSKHIRGIPLNNKRNSKEKTSHSRNFSNPKDRIFIKIAAINWPCCGLMLHRKPLFDATSFTALIQHPYSTEQLQSTAKQKHEHDNHYNPK